MGSEGRSLKKRGNAYVLVLKNTKHRVIPVGRLGRVTFPAGLYCYAGSGGANPVRRVQRHFARDKRVRWHIDYLTTGRDRMKPVDAYLIPDNEECRIAARLSREFAPIPGFGSSDCCCPTHLFYSAQFTAPFSRGI